MRSGWVIKIIMLPCYICAIGACSSQYNVGWPADYRTDMPAATLTEFIPVGKSDSEWSDPTSHYYSARFVAVNGQPIVMQNKTDSHEASYGVGILKLAKGSYQVMIRFEKNSKGNEMRHVICDMTIEDPQLYTLKLPTQDGRVFFIPERTAFVNHQTGENLPVHCAVIKKSATGFQMQSSPYPTHSEQ